MNGPSVLIRRAGSYIRANQLRFRDANMKSHLNVVILLLFLLQINGEERTIFSTCGRLLPIRPMIFEGYQSNVHWPWHAAIYHLGIISQEQQNDSPQYQCGGTLIYANTILTAAHCVCERNQALNAENVLVSLGKQNLSEISSSELLEVKRIIRHPNYSYVDLSNDIAIIKLSVQVGFDNHIQPICLCDSNKSQLSELAGKIGTVVGWGKTRTGPSFDVLQQTSIPVVDSVTCLESDRPFFGLVISTKTFCAGFRNGTSPCNGDSGGALTFNDNGTYYIRGIVSFIKRAKTGEQICDPHGYTVFTDVAKYLTWIGETVEVPRAKCEKRVSCEWSRYSTAEASCMVNLNITLAERHCKVLIENPDNDAYDLNIFGYLEVIPDLSAVFDRFKNMSKFRVSSRALYFSIEQNQLSVARRIKSLMLKENRIKEIPPDAFDDLSELEVLSLFGNRLREIHQDTLKKLYKLKEIWLQQNHLSLLPEGLFRNNLELEFAIFSSNYLQIISTDFRHLTKLHSLDLTLNICISDFIVCGDIICDNSTLSERQSKIWSQCRDDRI